MRKEWFSFLESFFCSSRTMFAAGLNENFEHLFRVDVHTPRGLWVCYTRSALGERHSWKTTANTGYESGSTIYRKDSNERAFPPSYKKWVLRHLSTFI